MSSEIALITGAASGIGLALAHEFAKHGHPLIITSRVSLELEEIAAELNAQHHVEVRTVAADLEDPEGAFRIFSAVGREGIDLDILVNNAGLGFRGEFWNTPIENDLSVINVNVAAIMRLTKLFLPRMLQRNRGRIMNTASIAGFEPGPYMAVYHASKAFVLSFSEALATELEQTKITVSTLCPGATDTDFFPKADMLDTAAFQKGKVMAPQEVAESAYQGLMRGTGPS